MEKNELFKKEIIEIIKQMEVNNLKVVYLGYNLLDNVFINNDDLGVLLVETNGIYNICLARDYKKYKQITMVNFEEKYKAFKTYIHYNLDFDDDYYYDLEDWNVEGEYSHFKIDNKAPNNYRTYNYDIYFKIVGTKEMLSAIKLLPKQINYELDKIIMQEYVFNDYYLIDNGELIDVVYDLAKFTPISKIHDLAQKLYKQISQ